MKHTKLDITRKRLTLIFTGVLFCVVVISGVFFLSGRYYHETVQSRNNFQKNVLSLLAQMQTQQNFLSDHRNVREVQRKGSRLAVKQHNVSRGLNEVSILMLDENYNVLYQNLKQDIPRSDIDISSSKIIHEDGYHVFVKKLGSNTVIFYVYQRYSVLEFGLDVLLLILITAFLGGIFYLVAYKLVVIVLKPVEENLKDMSEFIHNAGHELKTPLAVMRGNFQIMLCEGHFDKDLLENGIQRVDNMNGLIEGLIQLSEVGKNTDQQEVNIKKMTSHLAENFKEISRDKGVEIKNKIPKASVVHANEDELQMLISNILKNAVLYNKKKGTVTLSYHDDTLIITDTGIGMSGDEQAHMFDRFYRSQAHRDIHGFGIGLSLVDKICRVNKWKIEVISEKDKGSEFRVIFK